MAMAVLVLVVIAAGLGLGLGLRSKGAPAPPSASVGIVENRAVAPAVAEATYSSSQSSRPAVMFAVMNDPAVSVAVPSWRWARRIRLTASTTAPGEAWPCAARSTSRTRLHRCRRSPASDRARRARGYFLGLTPFGAGGSGLVVVQESRTWSAQFL